MRETHHDSSRLAATRHATKPLTRSVLWLAIVAVAAAVMIALSSDFGPVVRHNTTVWAWIKFVGIGATGIVSIAASFQLSESDHPSPWTWIPIVPLFVWAGACIADGATRAVQTHQNAWALRDSLHCVLFILSVGIPLAFSAIFLMRHSAGTRLARTTTFAGLGAAALAVFILQFFHSFDANMMDFAAHIGAIVIVVGGAAFSSQLLPMLPHRNFD